MVEVPLDRLEFREDRFVHHTAAQTVLGEMDFVLSMAGRNQRPLNLAVLGEGGSGKTSLIQQFVRARHLEEPAYSAFGIKRNIALFDLPPRVTPRKLLNSIVRPDRDERTPISLSSFAEQASEQELKLIVIDEFSELDATPKNFRHEVLHTMRWIGNRLRIPFIVAGTSGVEHVFRNDPQMGRRFKIINVQNWKPGREFEYFVYSYLRSLPGYEEVESVSSDLFDVLLKCGSRTTFSVTTLLSDAAFDAVSNSDAGNIHFYAKKAAQRSGYVV